MQKQAVFDITVSETYTEEAVTVTIKATSPYSAQSYGNALAAQMPSQTVDCGDFGLNDTEWFCSEVRLASATERADSAQSDARKELEKERNAAIAAQKQAVQYAKQMEQERDQAKKDAGHAISGINRHKRKLDKLKNDDRAMIQFVKQYHPDLLQNTD